MRLSRLAGALAVLVVLASATAGAQEVERAELAPLEILLVETRDDGQVAVEVAAPLPLTGTDLPASAFRVTQDGVDRPFSSQRLPNDELDIVLVIDVSGSMAGAPMNSAKEAAQAFLRQAPVAARIAVVSFGPEAVVENPFTNDFQAVASAAVALEPDGETALFDGVQLAIDQFPLARTSRRTIIVLSDGEDTVSESSLEDVSRRLSEADVDLYAVALGSVQLEPLQRMVDSADGGQLAQASSPDQLLALYDEIATILSNQYRLIFAPADAITTTGRVFVDHLGVIAAGDFTFAAVATTASERTPTDELSAGAVVARPEPTFAITEAPWVASDTARILGVGLLGLALFVAGLLLFSAGPGAVRMANSVRSVGSPQDSVEKAKYGAEQVAERFLARKDRGRVVGAALEKTGSSLRPAEFVVLVTTVAVAAGAILLLLMGSLAGLIVAALVVIGARSWLSYKAAKRSEAFTEQLGQTVQLLAGALRAGYALPGAFEAVSRETESPTSDEFHRLVTELRLGRDLAHSLEAMRERVQSEDFEWVVRAIDIHRQVGGDLAEVLDNINSTIRDRSYIRRQFKALSAEGRYSAYLLVALPFIVIAALLATSPDYIDTLFEDNRGRLVLASAFTSLFVGALWLKTMLKVRF